MRSVFSRTYPTLFRLVGYFVGIYLMGIHAFFSFYLTHLLLKAVSNLFYIDSDLYLSRKLDKEEHIYHPHILYIVFLNSTSALCAFFAYLLAINLFDAFISPQTIDMNFAQIYGLTIVRNILVPFEGVIKSQGSTLLKTIALKCDHLMTLFVIAIFILVNVDPTSLPYAWLFSSLIASSIVLVFGLIYWFQIGREADRTEGDLLARKAIWQEIIGCSMKRTNKRATFLIAKGAISALLGPFAGLALKAVRFNNNGRRQHYFSELQKRPLVEKVGRRIPASVKRGMTRAQVFWIVLAILALIVATMVYLRDTPNTLLLLGLFVLISKIISVGVRIFGLPKLVLQPKDEVVAALPPSE